MRILLLALALLAASSATLAQSPAQAAYAKRWPLALSAERAGAYRVYEDPADLLAHIDEVGGRR